MITLLVNSARANNFVTDSIDNIDCTLKITKQNVQTILK